MGTPQEIQEIADLHDRQLRERGFAPNEHLVYYADLNTQLCRNGTVVGFVIVQVITDAKTGSQREISFATCAPDEATKARVIEGIERAFEIRHELIR